MKIRLIARGVLKNRKKSKKSFFVICNAPLIPRTIIENSVNCPVVLAEFSLICFVVLIEI